MTFFLQRFKTLEPLTNEDSHGRVFDLPVEAAGRAKNLTWMSQATVRLPTRSRANVSVGVTVRGAQSNKAALRVD
jgi:hypothetical protein